MPSGPVSFSALAHGWVAIDVVSLCIFHTYDHPAIGNVVAYENPVFFFTLKMIKYMYIFMNEPFHYIMKLQDMIILQSQRESIYKVRMWVKQSLIKVKKKKKTKIHGS